MIATLTAYDKDGSVSHSDTRDYPDLALLWEHIGAQQNNRRTMRVRAQVEGGLEYDVRFSRWSRARRYVLSRRFHALLKAWIEEKTAME